ncbi:uncharacterized protein TNCV_1650492 [Trichonephila clavipes]|nr:uncharacterized protein TNCV_1650492 [Trichonephila clavipes]
MERLLLEKAYYDFENPASFGGVKKLSSVTKVPYQKAKRWLMSQDTYTLHKPVRYKFPRRATLSYGINDLCNTQASFRTKLARPITLTGEWEVGLSEIFIPRTWFNIGNHNNKYSITYEETKIVEKDYVEYRIRVKIDQGITDEEVISKINQSIEEKCGRSVFFCIGSQEYQCTRRSRL